MRIFLRKTLSKWINERTKKKLKRVEYNWKKKVLRLGPNMDENDFLSLFCDDFMLGPGDVIMIHAGYGMLKTNLSANDILDIIQHIVTSSGTIVVPTFPAMSSIEYMNSNLVFDARSTPSGMGTFSENVRLSPGAHRSTNPIKSIAAIGPLAEDICRDHQYCIYPFGLDSPYEKLLKHDIKIIGIGVSMSYLSFVHVAEDMYHEQCIKPIWEQQTLEKDCWDIKGQMFKVRSKVHNLSLMQKANPEKYCKKYLKPYSYRIFKRWMTDFFMVNGRDLTSSILNGLKNGPTIYD